jgi:hypothetical protein
VALHLPPESLRIVSETGTATEELDAELEDEEADQEE